MLCLKTGMPVFGVQNEEFEGLTDLYDVISYILATGRDYATDQETTDSKAARLAFIHQFPEYIHHSFWKLQFLPEETRKKILDWYYRI